MKEKLEEEKKVIYCVGVKSPYTRARYGNFTGPVLNQTFPYQGKKQI